MRNSELLSTIARFHPAIWDAIIPHGHRVGAIGDEVALNPQPLPPRDAFLIAAAEMAHRVSRLAVEADVRGESATGFLSEFIDDWCGTRWPRKWPWPWPGPHPGEGPQPDPWMVADARIVGAIVFASLGTRLGDSELGSVLLGGAERLAEAAGNP
jgi:hypothetical protein